MKFTSKVVHGQQHGRTIGYPTANIEVTDAVKQALEKEGVYAVKVKVKISEYAGALFYGTRALFKGEGLVCEILLLDFGGDLYNKEVAVEVLQFLREPVAVKNEVELKKLIEEDIKNVKLII